MLSQCQRKQALLQVAKMLRVPSPSYKGFPGLCQAHKIKVLYNIRKSNSKSIFVQHCELESNVAKKQERKGIFFPFNILYWSNFTWFLLHSPTTEFSQLALSAVLKDKFPFLKKI